MERDAIVLMYQIRALASLTGTSRQHNPILTRNRQSFRPMDLTDLDISDLVNRCAATVSGLRGFSVL